MPTKTVTAETKTPVQTKEEVTKTVPTTNEPTDKKYVGFWLRLVAWVIDYIILAVVSRILFGSQVTTMSGSSVNVQFDGIYILIPILYVILFWKFFAATPGKMILGMKIVQEDGKPLAWKHAILRWLGYIPSTLVLLIGFIWIAFDKKKQGWHDKIAKTTVTRK